MKRGESHSTGKGRRLRGETLWNGAAVAGLLCVGLLLGGIAGVFLDRQGFLGDRPDAPQAVEALPPAQADPPAP
ncbi:MAG TPA: hypothetical protein VIS03_14165, partial [Kiloniellaceae bacterium]